MSSVNRLIIMFCFVFSFITQPSFLLSGFRVRIFDIFLVILVLYFLTRYNLYPKVTLPRDVYLFLSIAPYLLLSIILPLIGIGAYNYPIQFLSGEIRWIQMILFGVIILYLYSNNYSKLIYDFEAGIKLVIILYFFTFIIQSIELITTINLDTYRSLWYGDISRHRDLGERGGLRFSGLETRIGYAGRVLSFSCLFLFYSYIIQKQNSNLLYIVAALLMLIATGHRTSVIALFVGVCLSLGIKNEILKNIDVKKVFIISISSLVLTVLSFILNIGRFRDPERYYDMLLLFTGQRSWGDVTGRDSERWVDPIIFVDSEYVIGTLANPSYVLQQFETFDSYFVILYLQGGVVLLFSYLLILLTIFRYGVKLRKSSQGGLLISVSVLFFLSSITQGMQGLFQKNLIVFSIVLILLSIIKYKSSNVCIR